MTSDSTAPRGAERSLSRGLAAILVSLLVSLVRLYRLTISPLLGQHCRFAPSCSLYAIDAIETHGPFSGSRLALQRVLRCRPGCDGGFDPVPPAA